MQQQLICASGFNGHGQLVGTTTNDIGSFRPISSTESRVRSRDDDDGDDDETDGSTLLFACWSTSVLLLAGRRVLGLGHQSFDIDLAETPLADGCVVDAFGDEDGMRGCFDGGGRLFLLINYDDGDGDDSAQHGWTFIRQASSDSSMRVRRCVVAGSGRVVIVVEHKEGPSTPGYRILGFDSVRDFLTWYSDPSASSPAMQWHSGDGTGQLVHLVAGMGTFLLLNPAGEVFSWGDPRYRALGRPVTGDGTVGADIPGIVEALSGLTIRKVASGGWLNAALSEDDALYVWGTGVPGSSESIKCLRDADASEVVLVEIPDERGEPLDIKDVAIGDAHIVVVVEGNRIFAVGENRNGQLGIDSDAAFVDDWTEVRLTQEVLSVHCGPKSTFITVRQ